MGLKTAIVRALSAPSSVMQLLDSKRESGVLLRVLMVCSGNRPRPGESHFLFT
jgi:hypothetical protein